jgi:diguanylate cyclase (GGDEF)-like protein
MIDHQQLLDHLSIGVAVLDDSLRIVHWNRWMEEHSLLSREEVKGKHLVDFFSGLTKKGFIKKAKEVIKFGRPVFFTQKVSQYIFPFPTTRSYLKNNLRTMQQTVILSPMKDEEGKTRHVLVSVFDVSDWVDHQNQLLRSKKELERLSQIDELTQIPNRRAIMDNLKEELNIHNRKNRPLAVAMVDIDHFKDVNDTFGHQCGDHVLYELANSLNAGLRGYDMVGRYGGEEFVMLLPETSKAQAVLVCERLRAHVEEKVFRFDGEEINLTVSIGIALKEENESSEVEKLLKVADDYLYEAKKAGRNRVIAQS